MLQTQIAGYTNLVDWTLSGTFDADVPVLLDADDPSRLVTRRSAEALISGLAGAFPAKSTVCLHLANDVTYPVLVLGILASGCRWTGTNTVYTLHELAHHFRVSQTKYVVTAQEHLPIVEAAVDTSGQAIEIILFCDILGSAADSRARAIDVPASLRDLRDLLQPPDTNRLRRCLDEIEQSDFAALMSTSGTTGLPKMAARTHHSMIVETAAIEEDVAAKAYEIRRLMSTPIFHAFTTPEVVINPLRVGYPTYIMKRFDASFPQKIHDYRITETAAAPPALKKLADTAADHHLLQGLKQIFCGGAPLALAERTRFLSIYKTERPRIVQVWGMTEGGWFTTFQHPEDDDTGSVGRPIPGYEIRVLPTDEVTLEHGRTVGELLIKGPQLMSHYFGNEAATQATFTQDGWLKTGDIGYIDEDGKVYLVDRAKDLLKVHAFQVAPAELEATLLQSPLVRDAGVCAAGQGNDEHPAMFVVPKHSSVTEDEVRAWMSGRLASYKVKYAEVVFVESIPKSPTGKILRKELRKIVDERHEQKAKAKLES